MELSFLYLFICFVHSIGSYGGNMCGSWRTTCGDWFFPSTIWALGVKPIKLGMEHLDAPSPTYWLKEPPLDSTKTNTVLCVCRQVMKYNEDLWICVVSCVFLEQFCPAVSRYHSSGQGYDPFHSFSALAIFKLNYSLPHHSWYALGYWKVLNSSSRDCC